MAKQLNVSLAFTANTNEAIAAIKRLQRELNELATGATLKNNGISQITPEIQKAMVAASELQAKLEAATNLKTGKLDLGQFSDSLKKSGVSLQQYANQLNALGPAGRKAFIDLAQSVIQAEAPLIRCSQRVKELGTSLANTARWQLSSSILHGFMGTVQSAYGYAKDLNESLNNIRIVTGASVAEMDAFAEKANKAARALSTTTNEYAKASLIYFQQGDTQAQAMQKADVTVKLANVTGQSAESVSDQLTAIWNNFNKAGDIAYEHFADVLTALGAKTASSTDEIAGGLEKFASIGETIGLSYEYAASALATITATTRQSEDVVGTALKTIFARIQGLNLGETLDDGVTLNKYSDALQKVGISIFEQNGEIKKMDAILDEMGSKWQTLSDDQQIALAQTVAGVRQYNQLVSLMDNWDFMGENLQTSYGAEGELSKQAEIYAESWEAARDRVRASAEELYTKLLDDDFFIGFLDGFEKVIDGISGLIDAFGGLKGVLLTIGSYATRIFHNEMTKGLRNIAYTAKQFTPAGRKEQQTTKEDAIAGLENLYSQSDTEEGKAENIALKNEVSMQKQLMEAEKRLTEEDLKQLQIQMDLVRAMDKRAIAAAKQLDIAKNELKTLQDQNRIRTKMDAQAEAREKGKVKGETEAGKKLWKQAQEQGSSGDRPLTQRSEIITRARLKAEQEVKNRHGIINNENISDYEDEISRELINQLPSVVSNMGLDKIPSHIAKIITDEVKKNTPKVDLNEVGKNVDDVQKKIALTGKMAAQGDALERLEVSTANKSGKDLDLATKQIQLRINEAKQSVENLKNELGKDINDDIKKELEEIVIELQQFSTEVKGAENDANKLQGILTKIQGENGIAQKVSDTAVKYGGEGGILPPEYKDLINQPSFDLKGQFEGAREVEKLTIVSQNSKINTDNTKDNLNETFTKAGGFTDWADGVANATNIIMSLGSAITSVQGLIDVFNNPDATAWDKISAVFTVIIGLLPVATSLFSTFGATASAAGVAASASMAAVALPIAAIVLGIGALIAAFVLLADAIHKASPAGQLEEATKATEAMSDAANKAKDSYQTLLDTINSYESATKKLEELEKGTNEFTQALLAANEQAQELIDKYNLLPEDYYIDDYGAIQFKTGVLDSAVRVERENVEDVNAMLMQSKIEKNNAQFKADINKLSDNYDSAIFGDDGVSYLEVDAQKIENLYSAIMEKGFDNAKDFIQSDALTNEDKKNLISQSMYGDLYGEDFSNYENLMSDQQRNVDTVFDDFINGMSKYENFFASNLVDNEIQNEGLIKNTISDVLSDERSYQQSEYKGYINDKLFNEWDKTRAEISRDYKGKGKDEIEAEFQQALGDKYIYEDGKVYNIDADGGRGNENVELSDLKEDQMKEYIINAKVAQSIEESGADLANKLNVITQDLSEEEKIMSSILLNGDFTKLTKEDMSKLKEMTPEDIRSSFPFLNALENLGVNVDALLIDITNDIQEWEPPKIDLSKTTDEFSEIYGIVSELNFGDTISEGEFLKLGDEADNYFTRMIDGTQKLTGDAQELYDLIMGKKTDELLNDISWNQEHIWGLRLDKARADVSMGNMNIDNIGKDYSNTYGPINQDILNDQINFAVQMGTMDQKDAETYQSGTIYKKEDIEQITLAAQEAVIAYKELADEIDTETESTKESGQAMLMSARSLEELEIKFNDLKSIINDDNIISDISYDEALQNAFENEIKTEGFDSEELNDYAKALMDSKDALVETREEANRLAIAHAKMERGINDLVDNWDSWNDAMKNGSTKEQIKTLGQMKKVMADIIGVDVDLISDDFINNAEAMELMERAAKGDMEALDALGPLFAKEYIADIGINNTNFQGDLATLQTDLLGMLEQFQMEDIKIGTSLDTSGYAMAMTEMIAAAGADIDTINSILAGMGFEPEVSYVEIPVDQYSEMVNSGTTTWNDSEGNSYTAVLDTTLQANENGMVKVPVINGSKTTFKGGGSSAASSGAKKGKGGGGGGGGGSKPKKADTVKKTDIVDRYKEIDDKIDDIQDNIDDASKSADRLWGPARLKEIQKINDALQKQIAALKTKRQEAENNLKIDQKALKQTIQTEVGVTITDADFDSEKNFISYDEILTPLYEEINTAITKANADGNADENEQEAIDKIQERINKVKEAIEQYDETRELIEDLNNEVQDALYEWQDNNYEKFNLELEVKVEINEDDLKIIDYYLSKIEDDVFNLAESMSYMTDQARLYNSNLKIQENAYKELQRQYNNNEISQSQYMEGMAAVKDSILENLQAIQEIDKAMKEYYEETLSMAQDELSKYTDLMENSADVLDHYYSLMELFGKNKDFDRLDKILQTQAEVSENAYITSQNIYQMFQQQAEERKDAYERYAKENQEDIYGINTLKTQWLEAEAVAAEAQDQMLSDAEAWAEDLNTILKNSLTRFADELEDALTGQFGSFDELLSQLDRASSLQEEFLTSTNKIYETNKLMRTAQKEIDKTTNSAAKHKLKNFINETNQLQQQGKLSQYELEIQQAKYNLLLAEIALREAQNAKTTVRLQRDSEGNFGYVYTANQNVIDEAQQKFEDSQNALYNKGLEGANNYTQKYIEIMAEMSDTLAEIDANEALSHDEKEQAKLNATNYYNQKLIDYSHLYQVALTTDSRIIDEAWSSDFAHMTTKTEDWMISVNNYVNQVEDAFADWQKKMDGIEGQTIGKSLDNLSQKTEKITQASEELIEMIINKDNGLIKSLMEEFTQVDINTQAYLKLRDSIQEVIKTQEKYLKLISDQKKYEQLMGSTVYSALSGQELIFDDYDLEKGLVLVRDPKTGNQLWVDSRLLTKDKNNVTKIDQSGKGWTDRDNINQYNYTDILNGYQDFNARKYSDNWDINNLSSLFGSSYAYGFGNLDFFDYYNPDYLTREEARRHKDYGRILGFDTGGYTGKWGPYGKMAMLHEKELVLNQHDTENLLASMEFLTRVLEIIDLQSLNNQLGGLLLSPTTAINGMNSIEQNVHIEASFPNATDHNEIELAFNDLINISSQYANRK